jgi:hypothetical protein
MTNLNRNEAIAILVWFAKFGNTNWGTWGKYPKLPVGASYLSYDTNPCQINLSSPVTIDGENYNCITKGRPVGAKWSNAISFFDLQEKYNITDSEIISAVKAFDNAERIEYLNGCIARHKSALSESNISFTPAIEQIFLRSEKSGDNYNAEIGNISFGSGESIFFPDVVEWHQVRSQGKNGRNKKRVFTPVSIPCNVITSIELKRIEMAQNRLNDLHSAIARYESELATLIA